MEWFKLKKLKLTKDMENRQKQLETLIEILDEMISHAYEFTRNSDVDIDEYMEGMIIELEGKREVLINESIAITRGDK